MKTTIQKFLTAFFMKLGLLQKKLAFIWKSHRKKTILGLVILGLIVFLIIKKSGNTFSAIHVVESGNITDQVLLSGRTESVNSVDLGFADSGRVNRVYVTEGQQVKKSQVLAELEIGDLSAQLTNARAGLTIALANLNQANNNVEKVTTEQDVSVKNAQRKLFSSDLEAVPDDLNVTAAAPIITGSYNDDESGSYRIEIYASNAPSGFSFRLYGLEDGYIGTLTASTSVPLGSRGLFIRFEEGQTGYGNTDWTISVPNIRSTTYATNYNAYQSALAARDRAIADARADIDGAMASVLQARVDQARSSINQILSAIERRRIIAPFSGTISQVALKEGESTIGISKDTSPGVSMLATDQYKVVIKIPEIDVARVVPNTAVMITLDAYGEDVIFNGILTTINPAETIVDGVPVYEGTVLFNEQDDRIRSGMTATIKMIIGERSDVLMIPANYIREDKVARKYFVEVIDPENTKKVIEREISIGIRGSDGMTEVVTGLSRGEQVVIKE
jgi:RND family efflux transporter MFP subunit